MIRHLSHQWNTWRRWSGLPTLLLMCSAPAFAQTDTVDVPSDRGHGEGALNAAVNAAISGGTLSNTVFRLEPYGRYVLVDSIMVPAGSRLTIIAPEPGTTQETAPPQILWTDSRTANTNYLFDCFGDITLRNIWLLYASTAGYQTASSVTIEDSPDTISGQHGTFDNVLFDYSGIGADGSGAVSVTARHFRGNFTNCYFKNCTDIHFRYYGRAVSFPYASYGWHTDSLTFENCTFANIGYVYMQEDGNYADVVRFNHCTFLNVVMFALESGWWHRLSVTNSLFENMYLYGDDPMERWPDSTEPYGGTFRIDSISTFGFPVPFTEQDRHILFTHSSYFIEDWVREYLASVTDTTTFVLPFQPQPQPMLSPGTLAFFDNGVNGVKSFPYMNRAHLYDSTDPGFILPPTNQEAIRRFLWKKWFNSEDTTWAFNPEDDVAGVWPVKEDLSYTNPFLLTSGMDRFPPGDLYHWFPQFYAQWKAQREAENARITSWLSTGVDPGGTDDVREGGGERLPTAYALDQNYPNPFNPSTLIRFQVPSTSRISIGVYDILGRRVRTLVDGTRSPGIHTVKFDGSGLASGVYFYRLTAGQSVLTRKMLILR